MKYYRWVSEWVEFNVPLDTIQVISEAESTTGKFTCAQRCALAAGHASCVMTLLSNGRQRYMQWGGMLGTDGHRIDAGSNHRRNDLRKPKFSCCRRVWNGIGVDCRHRPGWRLTPIDKMSLITITHLHSARHPHFSRCMCATTQAYTVSVTGAASY